MKKFNWLLVIGMFAGTLYYVIFQYDSSRLLTYLAIVPVVIAPMILNKTSFKLREQELFCYYLFIFFAQFLGCIANLYNLTWWYDIVMHFCSGIFTFLVGLFILDRIRGCKDSFWFKMFFGIVFVCFVALIWELFEFGADCLLNMDLQHNLDTGVVDTMEDMMAAFLGGISCLVVSIIYKKKKSLA